MASAVEPSVPNEPDQLIPKSYLPDASIHDASTPPTVVNEKTASGEPDPTAPPGDGLVSKDTLTTTPSSLKDVPPPKSAAVLPDTIIESLPEAEAPKLEVNCDSTTTPEPSELFPQNESISEEPKPDKIYPPPVSPTHTYQPPVPSLSMTHASKSPTPAKRTSIFHRRSWLPSEPERTSAPISPITSSSGQMNRSASIASSGASSACSANSATVQIFQPGTDAYKKDPGHKRQQSDQKYVRFMSAVSESQKRAEPERYVGYPGLVSHMTETQNLIFRRFDEIHVRLLLYLQDQISQLETQLRTLDERNIAEKGMHNGTFREDADQVRVEIMERLRILVGEYDTMILAFSRMQEAKASNKAIARLRDWLRKYSGAPTGRQSPVIDGSVAKDELEWVEKASDLANLSTNSPPTTNNVVGKQSPLKRLFPGRKR